MWRHFRSSQAELNLQCAIADAVAAMDLFFNNRFAESKSMFQKWYGHLRLLYSKFLADGPETWNCHMLQSRADNSSDLYCLNIFLVHSPLVLSKLNVTRVC